MWTLGNHYQGSLESEPQITLIFNLPSQTNIGAKRKFYFRHGNLLAWRGELNFTSSIISRHDLLRHGTSPKPSLLIYNINFQKLVKINNDWNSFMKKVALEVFFTQQGTDLMIMSIYELLLLLLKNKVNQHFYTGNSITELQRIFPLLSCFSLQGAIQWNQ